MGGDQTTDADPGILSKGFVNITRSVIPIFLVLIWQSTEEVCAVYITMSFTLKLCGVVFRVEHFFFLKASDSTHQSSFLTFVDQSFVKMRKTSLLLMLFKQFIR